MIRRTTSTHAVGPIVRLEGLVDGEPWLFRVSGDRWSLFVAPAGEDPLDVERGKVGGFAESGRIGRDPRLDWKPQDAETFVEPWLLLYVRLRSRGRILH